MNDPIAVLLVLGFIEWILQPGYGVDDMAVLFAQQLGIGLVAGVAVGAARAAGVPARAAVEPGALPGRVAGDRRARVRRRRGAARLRASSPSTSPGCCSARRDLPARRTVTAFHEGLAWVAQLGMFLTLGLLVFPSELDEVAGTGTLLALVVVFVARPLAVLVATLGSGFDPREKALLGWAGLRGAVPVVLALFPVIDDVPHSDEFFNIVFFAVLLSTLLQGTTIEPRRALARRHVRRGRPVAVRARGRCRARARRRRGRARDPARATPLRARGCATSGSPATRSSR